MTIDDKKKLRKELLKELYEHHDNSGGREASIVYTNLHTNEDDKQKHLAYEYLADKGLVDYKHFGGGNRYTGKITSYGIDEVESE